MKNQTTKKLSVIFSGLFAIAFLALGFITVAAHDGEIGRLILDGRGAGVDIVGEHQAQPDRLVLAREYLRHGLDHLDVVAVGRPDRDPQRHRAHREVIGAGNQPDQRQRARQRDQHDLALRGTRRQRCGCALRCGAQCRRPDRVNCHLLANGWQAEVGKSSDSGQISPPEGLERLWFNIVARIDTGRFGVRIKFA